MFQLNEFGEVENTEGTLLDRLKFLDQNNKLKFYHINSSLHQIFTNVRIKNFIEISGADRPPIGYEMAPVAFWTGILTVDSIRHEVIKQVKNWTYNERIEFNKASLYLDDNVITVNKKNILFGINGLVN